jgi:hypothetical protein
LESVIEPRLQMSLLDALHAMDDGACIANDQILMRLVNICALHEKFHPGKSPGGEETGDETVLSKPAAASDAAVCA